jgi:hypothetical protein
MATSVLNGGSRWTATVTALIVTESGQPVRGATVTGSWSNGAKGSNSCTTDTNGRCDLIKTGIRTRTGSVKLTVTNVAHAQYPYDKAANGMTSITVNAPNLMDQ